MYQQVQIDQESWVKDDVTQRRSKSYELKTMEEEKQRKQRLNSEKSDMLAVPSLSDLEYNRTYWREKAVQKNKKLK